MDDYKYDVRGRLRALRGYADSLRRCGTFNVEAESARLAARLSAFRDTAKVLPPIFATIMTEFDGDIRRYTDHLFGHSAVTSRRAFRKLLRRQQLLYCFIIRRSQDLQQLTLFQGLRLRQDLL